MGRPGDRSECRLPGPQVPEQPSGQLVKAGRAARACVVPCRVVHDVLDEQLPALAEHVKQADLAVWSIEYVILADLDHRQLAPARVQRIAQPGEFLLPRQQLLAGDQPLLTRGDSWKAHRDLLSSRLRQAVSGRAVLITTTIEFGRHGQPSRLRARSRSGLHRCAKSESMIMEVRAPRSGAGGSVFAKGPDLDRSQPGGRMLGRDLERLVQVRAVNHVIAGHLLFRLGKWPVRDQYLLVPDPDRRRGGDRQELGAVQPDTAL